MKSNEEIIKSHVPDWVRWHEQCRNQVLSAMLYQEEQIISEIWSKWANSSNVVEFDEYLHEKLMK